MTRADLEAAAEEKYPLRWGSTSDEAWGRPPLDDPERAAYIQGRLDQAEADARIAESVYPLGATVLGDAPSRIAQAIRQGVE